MPSPTPARRWPILQAGGQWTDEIPENVMKAVAHGLLAEILRRRADEDDVIFGDPATCFMPLVTESRRATSRPPRTWIQATTTAATTHSSWGLAKAGQLVLEGEQPERAR